MDKSLILVCTSNTPKQSDCGCCKDRGGVELLADFIDKIDGHELSGKFEVRAGPCMNQCPKGVSVRIHPDQTLYEQVKTEDLDEIIEEHLKQGQVVKRLKGERINRFMGF